MDILNEVKINLDQLDRDEQTLLRRYKSIRQDIHHLNRAYLLAKCANRPRIAAGIKRLSFELAYEADRILSQLRP